MESLIPLRLEKDFIGYRHLLIDLTTLRGRLENCNYAAPGHVGQLLRSQ